MEAMHLAEQINIVSKRVSEQKKFDVSADIFGGTQNTFSGSTFLGFRQNDWSGNITASAFQNKGLQRLSKRLAEVRLTDFANSRNTNFSGRIEKNFNDKANLFLKAAYFGEARNNGTPVQKNRTHFSSICCRR